MLSYLAIIRYGTRSVSAEIVALVCIVEELGLGIF